MDYSAVSMETSIRTNQAAILSGRCRVIQGDASELPFENGSFDLITAFETVYFWPKLDSYFRQVYNSLRPGGTFLICNEEAEPKNDKWSRLIQVMTIYSGEELMQLLKKAGFINISCDFEVKHHWLCVTAQKNG